MDINKSPTLLKYKSKMKDCISLYYPQLSSSDIEEILDYSINKRLSDTSIKINNSYTKKTQEATLLAISDYIAKREPLVTALGTMFKRHENCINPMFEVIQSFLDNRSAHKKQMFKYPKGSEEFEKYNLLQSLT